MADWPATYIPEEEKPRVEAAIAAAIDGRRVFELEHMVVRADGSRGWALSRAVPILDEADAIIEWFGAASDVTERRQAEEQRKLLLRELNHRVKNTLATVQSIAMQTLQDGCPKEVRLKLQERLISLARAHDVLTAEHWRAADLHEIARAALAPHGAAMESGRLGIEGPTVRLGPKAALALALALHELATNAVKYGALSGPSGRVALRWRAEGGELHLEWREAGGPPVAPPRRKGFGSRLLERGLVLELDARIERAFPPTGAVCTMVLPLARGAAAEDPRG
jgi:two-component sensor histidine kinase